MDFGKQVKIRLIEMGKKQTWLMDEITKRTGLFVDSSYLGKIFNGERQAPKVVQAIREILCIPETGEE